MAKKTSEPAITAVTAERARRLYRLLELLGKGPQTRQVLTRKLRLAVRGFYRDLEVLRDVGLEVRLSGGRYQLMQPVEEAFERLPFPDPGLTLGEARLLGRGRSAVHRKIAALVRRIQKS
jgi:biotin operon repressor